MTSQSKVTDLSHGLVEVKNKTKWIVSSLAATKPSELNFVDHNDSVRFSWWNVAPPNTDYGHAHEMLGKAYAYEFLDMINNPIKDEDHSQDGILAFIARDMAAQRSDYRMEAIADGFWRVINEYLLHGTAVR